MAGRYSLRDRNGKVQARWYDDAGQRHSQMFVNRTDAKKFLDRVSADRQRGEYINPKDGRRTVAETADKWLAGLTLRPKTQAAYTTILERRIKPKFGARAVASIDALEIQIWAKELHNNGAGLSAGTVRNSVRVMRQLLDAAVLARFITANPARSIAARSLPQYRTEPRRPLSADEVVRLAGVFTAQGQPEFAFLVRFAAETGMRAGELNALQWDAVDLPGRVVHVRASLSRVGTTNHTNKPKNGKTRTVEIGASLAAGLRDYADSRPVHPRFIEGAYVWPSADGAAEPLAWSKDFYLPHWKPAVAAAGLPADLRFHDLRHTCASLLIKANVPVKVIQERLGHSSFKITMDTYGHLFDTTKQEAANAMDAAFG